MINSSTPPAPSQSKIHYFRQPISFRDDQLTNLMKLAVRLNILSRGGPRYGQHSWRTLIALLADAVPRIITALDAHVPGEPPEAVELLPGVSLHITMHEGNSNGQAP